MEKILEEENNSLKKESFPMNSTNLCFNRLVKLLN